MYAVEPYCTVSRTMTAKFPPNSLRIVHGFRAHGSSDYVRHVRPRHTYMRAIVFMVSIVVGAIVLFAGGRDAQAAGNFKLKSNSVNEVSGAWHVFVTIELPRPPATAHVPLKFLFTKDMVYERALIDGHSEPVLNRQALQNQTPSVESLDVDFADGSGKIFKGTRFDFGLTRTRGYEAGEYKVQLRTADGLDIGGSARITLNGDNPVVDRRSITFNAKEKSIKKVDDGTDAGAKLAKNDTEESTSGQSQEVAPSGTAAPFIPNEAYQKQPEEEVKEHPKGCGCETVGHSGSPNRFGALGLLGLASVVAWRRARRR
jgi:MYXO-CTERM domain-containing protein